MTKDLHRHPEIKKLLEASEIRFQEGESLSETSDELNTFFPKALKETPTQVYKHRYEVPTKEFDAFVDSLTMNTINREALEKEWEEKRKNIDKYIAQIPLTPEECISGCGQRYERENQNQN